MRTRAERRKNNFSKIRKRKQIVNDIYNDGWCYKHDNQYSKGKIHCSCPLCTAKTKGGNYKHSDRQKIDNMDEQMSIYENEESGDE